MKIINPEIEVMHHGLEKDFMTPEQFIEKVGRTCYKSEDKITETSAEKFVSGLVKRGHEAMVEHWSLIFKTTAGDFDGIRADWFMVMAYVSREEEANQTPEDKRLKPFIRFTVNEADNEIRYIISGNMRAWRDYLAAWTKKYAWIPDYLHNIVRDYPTFFPEYQEMIQTSFFNDVLTPITVNDLVGDFEHSVHHDVTVKFICDRGVSHEIVRHRTASFAQESTRYCNYGLDKFDQCITVIEPQFIKNAIHADNIEVLHSWEKACCVAEAEYFKLLELGSTPQEARSVLPNSLKTEVIMTGNLDCWDHFFNLRCAPDAHPDIQVVAKMVRGEFHQLFPERYLPFGR